MSRQKELAFNTAILTFGKICTQFTSFLLLPMYTGLLLPEEYGIVDLFNTYIILLIPLFSCQFENGLFRFLVDCRDQKEKQTELFSTVLLSNLVQILCYLLFYAVFQRFILSEYKIFLAAEVCIGILLNTGLQYSRGIGHNITFAAASFLTASGTVVLNVILIAVLKLGATGLFLSSVLAKAGTLVFLVLREQLFQCFDRKKWSKTTFRALAGYSFPLIPNQLSWWVIEVSDRTIITYVLGVAANGIYSIATKFSSVFIAFYNVFNTAWTESAALHLKDADGSGFIRETINTMFRLFSAVCIGIIACMPFVFPWLVNAQYGQAYYQIPILMLAVLFQVIVGLYGVVYVALKKTTEIARTSFWAAFINLTTNVLLIRFIGLYAGSVSTLLAFSSMAVYRYFHMKKYIDASLDRGVLLLTALAAATTVCSYYLQNLVFSILNLLFILVYALVLNREFLAAIVKGLKKK